ncbi:uncharacterized protein BDR25DRAFT_353843 [Lindgomyces ingoldianus]|uniref:Uncharacterized protein n=1 Tax=Lindgomyces ingoldianus TaxID=673940 RepID=A0ACB6QYJ3_9PLEO|nr:uncharacterized protein BDR25DRAFT_353843 [Lindgomyces ingoldianus]KAF2472104.1 hypothetical protein BDR25DRAFT_353843 [Lindgomyces ingoldianus]
MSQSIYSYSLSTLGICVTRTKKIPVMKRYQIPPSPFPRTKSPRQHIDKAKISEGKFALLLSKWKYISNYIALYLRPKTLLSCRLTSSLLPLTLLIQRGSPVENSPLKVDKLALNLSYIPSVLEETPMTTKHVTNYIRASAGSSNTGSPAPLIELTEAPDEQNTPDQDACHQYLLKRYERYGRVVILRYILAKVSGIRYEANNRIVGAQRIQTTFYSEPS